MEKFDYGLIVVDPVVDQIVHFVGFWEKPTQQSIDALREELKTDEDLDLIDVADRAEIYPAPEEFIEEMWEIVNRSASAALIITASIY